MKPRAGCHEAYPVDDVHPKQCSGALAALRDGTPGSAVLGCVLHHHRGIADQATMLRQSYNRAS